MRDIQAFIDVANQGIKTYWDWKEAKTLPDQNQVVGFSCPICGEVYETKEEAEECRDQPYDNDGLSVGDIVLVPGAWNNNIRTDDPWLAFEIPPKAESESHFERAGYRVAFFVVTAIHDESKPCHRCLVTLASMAGNRLQIGWNPANGDGHYSIYKLDGVRRAYQNMYWPIQMGELYDECIIPQQVKEEAAALAALGLSTRSPL